MTGRDVAHRTPHARAPWDGAAAVEAGEAGGWILEQLSPLAPVRTPLSDACGLVLATDAVSAEPLPSFDTSAMDGYAIRPSSGSSMDYRVVGRSDAGKPFTGDVNQGECVRIMTGARVPPDTESVAPLEITTEGGGVVTVSSALEAGANIRRRGEDHRAGDIVVDRGTLLTPAHVATLSALGHDRPRVFPRPRVGVMSTGDELGAASSRAGIRDANRPGLLALVSASGLCPVDLGVVGDDADELQECLLRAPDTCDVMITTGGVSVGDHDRAKIAIAQAARSTGGVDRWMRVAVRPAKPLMFATVGGVPVFGLPGNPASAFVSYHLFVRPALERLGGHTDVNARLSFTASAAVDFPRRLDGHLHVVPVSAEIAHGKLSARQAGDGRRHHLAATAEANAYALLPDGPLVPAGTTLHCTWIAGRGTA